MNKDVKNIVLTIIEQLDTELNIYDFKRRKNSFVFTRKINSVEQKIEIAYFSHPSYEKGALLHIYPWLSVFFPEINERAEKIMGDFYLFKSMKGKTLRQPVQFGITSELWTLKEINEKDELCSKIKEFLLMYTIPTLNSLTSIEEYIKMCNQSDVRLFLDDRQHLYLAVAYSLIGDYVSGLKVLEERFGKPGSRKRYDLAFQYFEKKVGSEN